MSEVGDRRVLHVPMRLDHLICAAPQFDAAVDWLDQVLGIRATPGGQHPGRGTCNALVAIGQGMFLEIIGPDPEQPPPDRPRLFGIDSLRSPRVVTWAAKATELEALVVNARRAGIALGPVESGGRIRPDGVRLGWQVTQPDTVVADGIVPFFIDWGSTPHPSETGARGARIVDLRAVHPDADRVQAALDALGLDLPVSAGATPALIATIDGPKGRVELR